MGSNAATHDAPGAIGPGPSERRGSFKRNLFAVLAILLVVALLAGLKGAQIARLISAGKRARAAGPPPETVNTFVAKQEEWDETLTSVGSVTAARGVSISNDSPGIVSRIDFESGATVKPGQVLLELDTRVERSQLASARARQRLAAENLARTKPLVESGSLAKSQLDTDSAQLAGATADADALAAQIERKTVRAPFGGKLGIRLVNVGQYLAPGTPITVLESSEASYIDFDLPQQDLPLLSVGMPVRLTVETNDGGASPQSSDGQIFAIEPEVDPTTRNIKVRASMPASDDWLRPGMFVNVAVIEPQKATVVAIPATSVVHASYGDSVFIVEDQKGSKVARQQFVRVGRVRGDFIAITDGVHAGEEVVSGGAFKLRNGSPVVVDNSVEPHPQLAPHPPNR